MECAYNVKVFFTSEMSSEDVSDFCFVCNTAFGEGSMTNELFKKKFLDNIYGKSIVCIAYDVKMTPAGARALWRNDLNGLLAYQPCDTCVLEEHRKRGLFEKMTTKALELMENDAIVYNFPNGNSRHLYLKFGWSVNAEYNPRLWIGTEKYLKEHPEEMSIEYFDWWIKGNRSAFLLSKKIGDSYYIVKNRGKYYQMVIAKVSEKVAKMLPKADRRILLYWSKDTQFYNKNRESLIVLSKSQKSVKVPIWKIDVI